MSCAIMWDAETANATNDVVAEVHTSNGGCRREEKSRKQWSLFTMLLSSDIEISFICYFKSKAIVCIDCTENQRKIELSQMS